MTMHNPRPDEDDRTLTLEHDGSPAAEQLQKELENRGWDVEHRLLPSDCILTALADDGRSSRGYGQTRRKFIGCK